MKASCASFGNQDDSELIYQQMRRVAYIAALILVVLFFIFRSHLLELVRPHPGTYPTAEASKEVGRYETIVGQVAEVSMSPRGTVFIDFDADYPDQTFTAVIPARDVGRFAALDSFRDRKVGVTGRLDLYRGKPEIVVSSPRQLMIFN